MVGAKSYKALRYDSLNSEKIEDLLVVEESLLINVNYKPFTLTMRTPGNEQELTRGLLFTENILSSEDKFEYRIVEKKGGVITAVNVLIDPENLKNEFLDKRNLLSVSSCGICGKIEKNDFLNDKKPIAASQKVTSAMLKDMFDLLEENQGLYRATGGSHAVGCFDRSGKLLSVLEDIGRHNAVDKVIGDLILKGKLQEGEFLFVSGRVSYEIISKAYMAQIPYVIAVSASSTLAADLASELGITLIGFYRDGRFSCYSNEENLTLDD